MARKSYFGLSVIAFAALILSCDAGKNIDITSMTSGGGGGVPATFSVAPPYPNPFEGESSVRFALPLAIHARVVVQNSVGDEVKTLVDENLQAGVYLVHWRITTEKPGYYFVTLIAGRFVGSQLAIVRE